MIDRDLKKHTREFQTALAANKYEVTEGGIFFPAAHALAYGEYTHSVNGQDEQVDKNLITAQGLEYLLSVGLKGGTAVTAWYLALFSNNYTPVSGITASAFVTSAGEITSATEGYSESTRPEWVAGSISSIMVDNLSSKASFTIVTATELIIRGAGMLSSNVKGSTTGTLMSASKFSNARTQYNGDVFELGYRVRLQAA